jgi:hypothetical protein
MLNCCKRFGRAAFVGMVSFGLSSVGLANVFGRGRASNFERQVQGIALDILDLRV